MPSLNAILSLNAVSPSCSWGASTKLAVSTAGASSSTGPATVAVAVLVNCLRSPPRVQIAPETAHSRPAASVTVTSPSPSGSTVIRHRSWRRSTRRAPVTSPPSTVNESSRIDRKPIPISSLNATRKWNPSSPSCASGRPSKLAVNAGSVSGPGPGTMCAGTTDRARPSDVQTAPSASQSSVGARAIDRSSRLSGVTVISHTPLSPSTRAAPVAAPPATVRTRVRMASGVTATASLNARRKLNAVSPSCASGSPSNAAVSGSATAGQGAVLHVPAAYPRILAVRAVVQPPARVPAVRQRRPQRRVPRQIGVARRARQVVEPDRQPFRLSHPPGSCCPPGSRSSAARTAGSPPAGRSPTRIRRCRSPWTGRPGRGHRCRLRFP